jgi:FtsP/CotA-like multicopper oxidase with cupredoxin domain
MNKTINEYRMRNRGRMPGITRRDFLKTSGLVLGSAALIGSRALPVWAKDGCDMGIEPFPTSPLILNPFNDPLPIPQPLAPSDPTTWRDPLTGGSVSLPGRGPGQQDSDGGTHQIWTSDLGLPDPIYYNIKVELAEHSFTSSLVQPIDAGGNFIIHPVTGSASPLYLPKSTIHGYNGTFPGPMINAMFGKPVLVRFENHLGENPLNLDRMDFGAPNWAFLTHLHNGHTAAESDGNPFHKPEAYEPGQWCDNLYLNYPPDGDAREMQSFLWFHDHVHGHTGANVYKGMVGLYPIYDPHNDGDETNRRGLRLPGRRRNNPDGTFSVDYDIPLAFYDCVFDDGVTPHRDFHIPAEECGDTHSEWWGKSFFRHYPNHGFVGDVFTVNGKAYPVLEVKRRKYRLRFLDASIARCYEFLLMHSTRGPMAAPGTQGQWQLPDGDQCMQFVQIANEGGLLPNSIVRNSFELWPAKRKEFIVDFTKYMDGTPTRKGDEIYLVNVMEMTDGRKPEFNDPDKPFRYKVPVMKIVIGDDPPEPDVSVIPTKLRTPPPLPSSFSGLRKRRFVLERGGADDDPEAEWLINDLPFDHMVSMADVKKGSAEVWEIENKSGGWTHPMHIHQEEHRVISRKDGERGDRLAVDDTGKEDVIALDPGETVTVYRKFRTFTGKYVAHCHNLAHEDHAMMFSWRIVP